MKLTSKEKKEKIEQFFASAFCAQKATLLKEKDGFKLTGVVEIETGDKRGTIYVACVEKISPKIICAR